MTWLERFHNWKHRIFIWIVIYFVRNLPLKIGKRFGRSAAGRSKFLRLQPKFLRRFRC